MKPTIKPFVPYLAAFMAWLVVISLASAVTVRLDLSPGRTYTLAKSTDKIVRSLKDIVTITFYVSGNIPSRLTTLRNEVQSMLAEYKRMGGKKIVIKTIDPQASEETKKDAREAGLAEIRFSQVERDAYQLTSAYFGLTVAYGDKKEVVPQLTDPANLEYTITAAIYKLTKDSAEIIGLAGANPDTDPKSDPYLILKQILYRQYVMEPVAGNSVLSRFSTILIFDDGSVPFDAALVKKLRDYAGKGGKLVIFTDGVRVSDTLQTAAPADTFSPLFGDWGISPEPNLVYTTNAELVQFANTTERFLSGYAPWVKTNAFNKKTPYFSNVISLTFPWTSSVLIQKKGNITTDILVASSPQSWTQKEPFKLMPQDITVPQKNIFRAYPLIVRARNSANGTLAVIPSSRFIKQTFLNQGAGNFEFVFNLVNDLSSGGALSGIRSRNLNLLPLPAMAQQARDIFKIGVIGIPSLLFILWSGLRLRKRSIRR